MTAVQRFRHLIFSHRAAGVMLQIERSGYMKGTDTPSGKPFLLQKALIFELANLEGADSTRMISSFALTESKHNKGIRTMSGADRVISKNLNAEVR